MRPGSAPHGVHNRETVTFEEFDPVLGPSFVDVACAASVGNRCREDDHVAQRRELPDEVGCGGLRQVLAHLKAERDIESPLDGEWATQVDYSESIDRDLQPLLIDVRAVEPEDVVDAVGAEHSHVPRPQPTSMTDRGSSSWISSGTISWADCLAVWRTNS